jgi:phosphatidylserine/phosphatidylglycerophosphate/cardiolipin synthase-like enzyme
MLTTTMQFLIHSQLMSVRLLCLFVFFVTTTFAQSFSEFALEPQTIEREQITFTAANAPQGKVELLYGVTPALELGLGVNSKSNNSLTLSNLQPAQFYYVQPFVWTGRDTVWGSKGYYSTQSQSTGEIQILFNQGIDTQYSTGGSPVIAFGGSNIENAIITKINQAQHTVDVAVFNNTRTAIVNALKAAHNRGVQIRYLANAGTFTSNAALVNGQPNFPVAYVNMADLMHNKFVVIDAQSVDSSWVWTGSCNWTYTDMFTNYNNIVLLQDQALANAYTLEFNEMWGGSGNTFNATNSRVGSAKTNNTPHFFNIGGRTVELYFSPSDNVTSEIVSSLNSANNDVEFCLLSFTRNDLGTAILNLHRNGILEHGIMENINDSGSEYSYLTGLGVNLLADNQPTALHHKYAIVDAGNANSDPQVITGSHNWTTAAEFRNDENTLIIHDATIANIYLQEFTLRWCQNKNNTNCNLPFSVWTNTTTLKEKPAALKLYPNPTNQTVTIELEASSQAQGLLEIYSLTGQLIQQQQLALQHTSATLNVSHLSNGVYWLRLKDGNKWYREKLFIVR